MSANADLFKDDEFKRLDAELWLQKRITQHLAQVFNGDTEPSVRKDRIRRAIIAGELDLVICGRKPDGKPETYAQVFERMYGEALHPKQQRKSTT